MFHIFKVYALLVRMNLVAFKKANDYRCPDVEFKDTLPEKKTGYMLDGKEVILSKQRGRPRKIRNPLFYPEEKKVEACSLYAVLGDVQKTSELTGVPEKLLRTWKEEYWWIEITRKMYIEQNEKLLNGIETSINRALNEISDRLENGDWFYSRSEKKLIRKPIDAKTLAYIFDTLAHKRQLIRGEPTSITVKTNIEERLDMLKERFVAMGKEKDIEGEVLESSMEEIKDA